MSRTETPISPKDPRHHPAVGKSNRSFNSNSRSNPRTTTRRNKPPPSPRGGRAPTYLDHEAASIGRRLNASRSRSPSRSSSRFPCRPGTAFGTPAACRNAPAPASRLPVLGPMLRSETSRGTARRAPRRGQFRTTNGPSRHPTNGGAAQILYSKASQREIQKACWKWRVFRLWAPLGARLDFDPAALGSGFRQKCHTESVSDSRLLREARMLHYGATSRSARIVVTLLHESLGPTTAGASLFWTPDSPPVRVGRPRPRLGANRPGTDLAKQA